MEKYGERLKMLTFLTHGATRAKLTWIRFRVSALSQLSNSSVLPFDYDVP